MNLDKENIRKIRGIILFTGVVVLALIKFDLLWETLVFIWEILQPFVVGGMMAFVANLPMTFFEKKVLAKLGKKRKHAPAEGYVSSLRRGFSILLAYLVVVLLITLVSAAVIPQLIATVAVIAEKAPAFSQNALIQIQSLLENNPKLLAYINEFDLQKLDWNSIMDSVVNFLKNGMGNMLSSTFTVASGIVSGTVNGFIALVFSVYILAQKEKLGEQFKRVLRAYTSQRINDGVLQVCTLLYRNFSNFIIGQCTEAVILGLMFIVSMTIFRFDYAVMIGVLIAFTALIPIVGAFVGCFVGAFVMLVDDPVKAIWFVVLFIVLQQIEGNLIYPHVVGNSVGLPSIWVLAAVTIGGSLMGIFGMLVFIPLLSTVYMLLRENVNRREGLKAQEKG